MLIGAEFLYSLTLESTIKEWPLPQCQVPLERVPKYMHLVKIGLLTENEVCERLYGYIIADADTRSTEQIDAVYTQALREGYLPESKKDRKRSIVKERSIILSASEREQSSPGYDENERKHNPKLTSQASMGNDLEICSVWLLQEIQM